MSSMLNKFLNRLVAASRNESGASAVEYAVLGSCIAAVVVATIADVGQKTKGMFDFVFGIIASYIS